jgi:hypothetical protein
MGADAGQALITQAMLALVGEVRQRLTSYPVSASDIRRWALAIYYPDAPPERYVRAGAAAGESPLVAPEEFNPFAWTVAAPKGAPRFSGPKQIEQAAGAVPPVKFSVNGGSTCEYGVAMQEGDVITSETRITSYSQKQGSKGPLLFTDVETRWTNQRGEMVKVTVQTGIRY